MVQDFALKSKPCQKLQNNCAQENKNKYTHFRIDDILIYNYPQELIVGFDFNSLKI